MTPIGNWPLTPSGNWPMTSSNCLHFVLDSFCALCICCIYVGFVSWLFFYEVFVVFCDVFQCLLRRTRCSRTPVRCRRYPRVWSLREIPPFPPCGRNRRRRRRTGVTWGTHPTRDLARWLARGAPRRIPLHRCRRKWVAPGCQALNLSCRSCLRLSTGFAFSFRKYFSKMDFNLLWWIFSIVLHSKYKVTVAQLFLRSVHNNLFARHVFASILIFPVWFVGLM